MNTILWSLVGALSGVGLGILILVLQSAESKTKIVGAAANFVASILQRKALFSFMIEVIITFAWIYGWFHTRADGITPVTGVDVNMWSIVSGANFGGYATVNVTEKAKGLNGSPETPAA